MNYYKILNKEETHNNLKYKTGLNTDPLPFNPRGDCELGGIYFSREDIFAFLEYGPYIRKVTLPKDAKVYENPGTPKKWKADKVILGRKRKWNNPKLIKELIAEGAISESLLIQASYNGHLELVKLLIKAGVDVNIQDKRGDIPLHEASRNGYLEIVKLLIKAGVDLNIQDNYGNTALIWASNNGHLEIVKLLINEGVGLNIQNKDGNTVLIWASKFGHLEIVKLLIKAGADPNIQNNYGETALIWASRSRHLDIVIYLKSVNQD